MTHITDQTALELTLEEVDNDRVIPSLVIIPALLCDFIVRHVVKVGHFNVRFLQNPIHVFVETIE